MGQIKQTQSAIDGFIKEFDELILEYDNLCSHKQDIFKRKIGGITRGNSKENGNYTL